MRRSEYETQAFINDGLNQQNGLDSQEGSAALSQANKPQVDGTDIQKARFLAAAQDRQVMGQSVTPTSGIKPISHGKRPMQRAKTVGKVKNEQNIDSK